MVEDTHEHQDTKLEGSYKEQNALEDRLLPNSPARLCAQNMSKRTTVPEDSAMYPGLVAADAGYLKKPVREPRPRAARQARNSALFMRLQSRPGHKRHLDDYNEELEAGERLHKRVRAQAEGQSNKETTAHERTSVPTGRGNDADKRAKTEQHSRKGRSCQHGTPEDPSRHQNSNMDEVEPAQDGTTEGKEHRSKREEVESSAIAPLDITTRWSDILQSSDPSRPSLGAVKKKVRFEDKIPAEAIERPACPGDRSSETLQGQMAGSGPQILDATQRGLLNQPPFADVVMVDIEATLSALSLLQAHQ